ncbi:MAG: hypothetical protein C4K48_06405 [Candidatus Thorarchaeota archaeon]|nr:MAG: hypothetical protein C4K48_06405 [Candidatus Thorarchaeota archaeon]
MKARYSIAGLIVCILSIVVVYGASDITAYNLGSSESGPGPYVDAIDFTVISGQDQRILALLAGEIEMDTSVFDPIHYDTLNADPDIDVYTALRNGYGQLTINCRDAPLNESVLRRAFAFAFDKQKVTTDIMGGWSQEHDSLVPFVNSWCIEDELMPHYYSAQATLGNQLLNASGLFPYGGDGWRTYKNQTISTIEIEYSSSSVEIAGGIAQIGVDALLALDIHAETKVVEFYECISRLGSHGEYDMVFYVQNFYSNDVDWLANEYWSDYANRPYRNPTNFANATFDACRQQLLNSTTYYEVYNASAWMQRVLHYNVPRLVVYEDTYLQAYRTDEFTGHVEDLGRYITGPWTMTNIHRLDGTYGGTVPVAIADRPDTFNIYVTNSAYSVAVLENLYSSLYKYGPDLKPRPDLAENMLVETHDDNAAVPVGHSKYTIDIIQNATWNDGMPLTAMDVEFTFTYMLESYAYGNPAAADLGSLVSIESTSIYTVVLEFDTESYWQFSNFAYDYILPYHVYGGTPYSSWSSAITPDCTSGPFYFDSYGTDWYRIRRNLVFYYGPPNPAPVVNSAEDLTYVEGTTGNVIVWEVSDDNPLLYSIFREDNLTAFVIDFWNGSDISLDVDGLSVGSYSYTLFLSDFSANIVFSSTTVTVIPATTTSTVNPGIDTLTLLVAVGAVGIIAIVAVVIWKSKQS